ncbi:MAG: SH3 domain-containing protein [Bacteroidota bacterium]
MPALLKQLTSLFLLLLLAGGASSAELSESQALALFEKGNAAYKAKDFAAAEQAYLELMQAGYRSKYLYYNLSNAAFKQGKTGMAILNLERAKSLDPLDEDINFNLRMVYAHTVDKIEPLPLLFHERWWRSLLTRLDPDRWAWISVIAAWLACAAGIAYLFAPRVTFKRNAFFMLCGTVALSLALILMTVASRSTFGGNDAAVILSSEAVAKSSPESKSTTLFILHEGTKVELEESVQEWTKVRIANGNVGWIESRLMERI